MQHRYPSRLSQESSCVLMTPHDTKQPGFRDNLKENEDVERGMQQMMKRHARTKYYITDFMLTLNPTPKALKPQNWASLLHIYILLLLLVYTMSILLLLSRPTMRPSHDQGTRDPLQTMQAFA